jgi:hypothetical protein
MLPPRVQLLVVWFLDETLKRGTDFHFPRVIFALFSAFAGFGIGNNDNINPFYIFAGFL